MFPSRLRRAAYRAIILSALPFAWLSLGREAQAQAVNTVPASGARPAPSRPDGVRIAAMQAPKPARLNVVRFKKIDYVGLAEIAAQLEYKVSWNEVKRELTLRNGVRTLVFTTDRREVSCDGRRFFLGDPVLARDSLHYVGKTDYEGGLLAIMRPDLAGPLPSPLQTIAIDPGHGGNDPGMENESLHLQEKVLTLDVALLLEKLLLAQGYRVVLTRRDDRNLGPTKPVDWQQRAVVANVAGADLMVSIHFNSLYPNTRVGGTETFVFTRRGQRSDQSLGAGQTDDAESELVPVNRFDPWSSLFAHEMQGAVLKKLGTSDRGVKSKHSAVLRGLNCPGILVESVFLSNEAEAKRAATPEYRQKIAEGIADGIQAYASTLEALRPKSAWSSANPIPSSPSIPR